jgi:hypothetical protein
VGTEDNGTEIVMWGLIALLLVVWLALAVIGAVIEGLFWLVVVGAVLFVATAALGWVRRRSGTRV